MVNKTKRVVALVALIVTAIVIASIFFFNAKKRERKWVFICVNGEIREGSYQTPKRTLLEMSELAGKSSGTLQLFSPSGQVSAEYQFSNGNLNGYSKLWNSNGQLLMKAFYLQGKQDGLYLTWHDNGTKSSEGEYHEGREIGQHLTWHDNGRIKSDSCYVNGLRHGRCRRWAQDGSLFADGVYSNMWAQDGTFILEKKEGKPPVIGVYSNGVLIEKRIWKPAQ